MDKLAKLSTQIHQIKIDTWNLQSMLEWALQTLCVTIVEFIPFSAFFSIVAQELIFEKIMTKGSKQLYKDFNYRSLIELKHRLN